MVQPLQPQGFISGRLKDYEYQQKRENIATSRENRLINRLKVQNEAAKNMLDMQTAIKEQAIAAQEAQRKRRLQNTKIMRSFLGSIKPNDKSSYKRVVDQLETLGVMPDAIARLRSREVLSQDEIKEYRTQLLGMEGKLKAPEDLGEFREKERIKAQYITPPTPTDIDDFVADADAESIRTTGKPLTPGNKNKARLQFKRAQAREVRANRFAERDVDSRTAEKIKYNERLGARLAEIATQGSLMTAKGEVSPVEQQMAAKKRMEGNLAKLANHYITLDSTGAMLNVDNSTFDNILAASRASKLGQMFGRITGSNEQSIRSSINKLKPLIIQDIRQSTNMSARGLDSEKELEFYLQAATDEKTDIQSNIAALVVLDEAYGTGIVAEQLRNLTDESLIRRISADGLTILNKAPAPKPGQPPIINTQQEFDALPSGTIFIEDGKKYRKP